MQKSHISPVWFSFSIVKRQTVLSLGVFANDVCLCHVSCFKCGKKKVWCLLITVHMGFVNKQFLHHVGKEGEELWEEPNVGKVPVPVHYKQL